MKLRDCLLPVAAILLLPACEEEPPSIRLVDEDPLDADTSYVMEDYGSVIPQEKAILLDYFTGVRCVNCPAAMESAKNLKSNRNEEIVIASYHPGESRFTEPHTNSVYDFRLSESQDVFEMLGAGGMPTAAVDRIDTDGDGTYLRTSGNWASMINEAATHESPVNITVSSETGPGPDEVLITVDVLFLQPGSSDHRLTVLIKESGFTDFQLFPSPDNWKEDYVHDFVVRKFLTRFNGTVLSESNIAGRFYSRNFILPLNAVENVNNARVVAFVHNHSDVRRVVHVKSAAL